jgi:hypothetical protein
MGPDNVEVYAGEFETSMACNCGRVFEGRVQAMDSKEAARATVTDARREGWEDGPLCPKCVENQAGAEDEDEDEDTTHTQIRGQRAKARRDDEG